MVGVLLQYSNRLGLCEDLLQVTKRLQDELARASTTSPSHPSAPAEHSGRRFTTRRLEFRLTQEEIEALVQAFKDGTSMRRLAEQYGVSMSGVKDLLRKRGVRRGKGR